MMSHADHQMSEASKNEMDEEIAARLKSSTLDIVTRTGGWVRQVGVCAGPASPAIRAPMDAQPQHTLLGFPMCRQPSDRP
jgi:predicted nucleic acid-binding Zn ribbon protein